MSLCESPHVNNERITMMINSNVLSKGRKVSKSFITVSMYLVFTTNWAHKKKKRKFKLFTNKE